MKAIILAGGSGSRLYPLTQIASKHLQAVYDKPMIYYPLTTLIAAGVREFCIIATPQDTHRFADLLEDGAKWGISIVYRSQPAPRGIGEAFLIAETFIGGDDVVLMLGDNIFVGGDALPRAIEEFTGGALVFAYHVQNPSEYGVVEFDRRGLPVGIVEKPALPKSNFAIPGLYIYDSEVVAVAKNLVSSDRGEYEISDVNREYLRRDALSVRRLNRGYAWLDAGTSRGLHEAAAYIEMIERRQGVKFGCPEEAALVRGFVSLEHFENLLQQMPACDYRSYLSLVAAEARALRGEA